MENTPTERALPPWQQRQDWIDRRVVHSHAKAGLGLVAFAVVWNALLGGIIYVAFGESPTVVKVILAVFGALGLLLLYGGIRATARGFRFGSATLVLPRVPISPGTRLDAVVEAAAIPDGGLRATLSCRQLIGKDERVLWSAQHDIAQAAVRSMPFGVALPIHFEIPGDAQETDGQQHIMWQLNIGFNVVGSVSEMSAYFDVPVFRTQPNVR
jgi:hypothetical protein